MLQIAKELELPIDAATQTFAFIARKGAGTCIWKIPDAEEMQIRCQEHRGGEICYGELVIIHKETGVKLDGTANTFRKHNLT